MSSEIFNDLLEEKADQFRAAFSTVSESVFYDEENDQIRHTGEYGTFREAIVRNFLQFVIPRSLDISTGFVITPTDDISTQCDVVVFNSQMTPLYEENDRQRFFPVESVSCIIEVKSSLSKIQLKDALNKLARVKELSDEMINPSLPNRYTDRKVDPTENAYDRVPTILICNDLFSNRKSGPHMLPDEIDDLYEDDIHHRHKHNMILSIENGLLSYYDENGIVIPYPEWGEGTKFKHRYSEVGAGNYWHFNLFTNNMFLLTNNKTQIYPEIAEYVDIRSPGQNYDQI